MPRNSLALLAGSALLLLGVLVPWHIDSGYAAAPFVSDLATGRELLPRGGHKKSVTSLVFTPDGKTLYSGSADRSVREWNIKTGKYRIFRTEHANAVTSLVLSPDGKTIASRDPRGTVYLHDRKTGNLHFSFTGEPGDTSVDYGVASLVFTADGKRLIAGNRDGTNRVWDVATRKRLRDFRGNDGRGSDIALSPDGVTLAVVGRRSISLVDLREGKEIGSTRGRDFEFFFSAAFSPDGKILAATRMVVEPPRKGGHANTPHRGYQIVLFEVATRQEILVFGTPALVNTMIFEPDGRTVITGGGGGLRNRDESVRIWDVSVGKEIARRDGPRGGVESVALSLDGKTLASGGSDGTILLWKKTWPAQWQPAGSGPVEPRTATSRVGRPGQSRRRSGVPCGRAVAA